jgi:hypothetical protein
MKYSTRLLEKVNQYYEILGTKIKDESFTYKADPNKWSGKEILGHLCDSASNNHRRFIRILKSTSVVNIEPYDQNLWVNANNYQSEIFSCEDVLELWRLLNKQIACVLDLYTEQELIKEVELNDGKKASADWLIQDYFEHMNHHLEQLVKIGEI